MLDSATLIRLTEGEKDLEQLLLRQQLLFLKRQIDPIAAVESPITYYGEPDSTGYRRRWLRTPITTIPAPVRNRTTSPIRNSHSSVLSF